MPGGPAAEPLYTIKVEKGFIDDALAISSAAGKLVVLFTDAASFARLDVVALATGKPKQTIKLGDPQRLFERVLIPEDGEGLVLISRDAGSGKRSAQYFDAAGKARRLIGPFAEFGVTGRGEALVLVTDEQRADKNGTVHVIAQHRLGGLSRVGKPRRYRIGKDRALAEPSLTDVGWQAGHSELVGMKPGSYDAKRDIRLPASGAVLDLLTGQFTWEAEVKDVYAWAAADQLRQKLPDRRLFAILSPDARLFDLVDFRGARGPVGLPVPLRYYDPSTLRDVEAADGKSVTLSLATDPLHPEALARQKKDPIFLDFYQLQVAGEKTDGAGKTTLEVRATHRLRAPGNDRPTTWRASDKHVAVLRKFKNFSRGGDLVEVFALPDAP